MIELGGLPSFRAAPSVTGLEAGPAVPVTTEEAKSENGDADPRPS